MIECKVIYNANWIYIDRIKWLKLGGKEIKTEGVIKANMKVELHGQWKLLLKWWSITANSSVENSPICSMENIYVVSSDTIHHALITKFPSYNSHIILSISSIPI